MLNGNESKHFLRERLHWLNDMEAYGRRQRAWQESLRFGFWHQETQDISLELTKHILTRFHFPTISTVDCSLAVSRMDATMPNPFYSYTHKRQNFIWFGKRTQKLLF